MKTCDFFPGKERIRCIYQEVEDLAKNWPVYAYTVRNIGPICLQYLKSMQKEIVQPMDETVRQNILSLANAAQLSDSQNKLTFQILCTESAHLSLQKIKFIGEKHTTRNTSKHNNIFTPAILIASQEELHHLLPLLGSANISKPSIVLVFLKDKETVFDTSEIVVPKSTLWTFASKEEIFTTVDDSMIERLVFQLAESMVDCLRVDLEKCNSAGKQEVILYQ